MGASVAVRHAALHRGVRAVVAVSGPARWYYRGTAPMRRVHWVLERRLGGWWASRSYPDSKRRLGSPAGAAARGRATDLAGALRLCTATPTRTSRWSTPSSSTTRGQASPRSCGSSRASGTPKTRLLQHFCGASVTGSARTPDPKGRGSAPRRPSAQWPACRHLIAGRWPPSPPSSRFPGGVHFGRSSRACTTRSRSSRWSVSSGPSGGCGCRSPHSCSR